MKQTLAVKQCGDGVAIVIPMQLKKRQGRREIIVPEGLPGSRIANSPAQEPLLSALARASHWRDLIESGEFDSIPELANALKLDRSYVRRILELSSLSPDIIEAIVEGREPSGLSLERMRRVPVDWNEQKIQLGFCQRSGCDCGESCPSTLSPREGPDLESACLRRS
ncbi:MAG: hypothetical protein AAF517_11730 [Planctomycetota bacterium]